MRSFEEFWEIALLWLDNPREVRNWTAYKGDTVGGRFVARSYRSLSKEEQSSLNNGYPYSEPEDWIVHTQVKRERLAAVSKKEFQDRYESWRAYKDRRIIRKDFDGKTKASGYLISIFWALDKVMN